MLSIDKTVELEIHGSTQRVRLCAKRAGLPPILIVQAGPGFPVLHEVRKYQRRLHLESDFLVAYWDQRGCGVASRHDALGVSFQQQVEDVRAVLQWLHDETRHDVIVLGVSLGATYTLQAVQDESNRVKAVIAISPDADTARSDAAAHAFLQERARRFPEPSSHRRDPPRLRGGGGGRRRTASRRERTVCRLARG